MWGRYNDALRMHASARVHSLWAVAVAAVLVAVRRPAPTFVSATSRSSSTTTSHRERGAAGAIPEAFHEGIQSGIPAHVRYTVELWQYQRYWRGPALLSRMVERQLAYNVVTKEYKVSALQGETREPHLTRDLRDAQRVLSELRGLKLTPAGALDPAEVIYVRVHAETALNGENSFVARMTGDRRADHAAVRVPHAPVPVQ